ncbi:hypothetical protein ACV229_26610 [Burkholderia sp. MR1-5-21]
MEVVTNIEVYWAIAQEAHAAMRLDLTQSTTPNQGGKSGNVIRWNPDRQSFKNAMIAIAFAGMYLEALMFISLQRHFGRDEALKIDRKIYEDRLRKLGITDSDLLDRVTLFREARKDLVHEKALLSSNLGVEPIRLAQEEADRAISLVRDLCASFLHPSAVATNSDVYRNGAEQREQHK